MAFPLNFYLFLFQVKNDLFSHLALKLPNVIYSKIKSCCWTDLEQDQNFKHLSDLVLDSSNNNKLLKVITGNELYSDHNPVILYKEYPFSINL